jgi:hypothetical protein
MANVTAVKEQEKVELSKEALLSMIEELKKPYVDPKIVEQKERERREMREEWERNEELRKQREEACGHLREDNTSAIAWLTNSDGIRRGVCQRCNAVITPNNPRYLDLLRIPTRGQGIVYV